MHRRPLEPSAPLAVPLVQRNRGQLLEPRRHPRAQFGGTPKVAEVLAEGSLEGNPAGTAGAKRRGAKAARRPVSAGDLPGAGLSRDICSCPPAQGVNVRIIWRTLVALNGPNSEHVCEAMPIVRRIIAGRDARWARSRLQAAPNSSTKLSQLPRPTTFLFGAVVLATTINLVAGLAKWSSPGSPCTCHLPPAAGLLPHDPTPEVTGARESEQSRPAPPGRSAAATADNDWSVWSRRRHCQCQETSTPCANRAVCRISPAPDRPSTRIGTQRGRVCASTAPATANTGNAAST